MFSEALAVGNLRRMFAAVGRKRTPVTAIALLLPLQREENRETMRKSLLNKA